MVDTLKMEHHVRTTQPTMMCVLIANVRYIHGVAFLLTVVKLYTLAPRQRSYVVESLYLFYSLLVATGSFILIRKKIGVVFVMVLGIPVQNVKYILPKTVGNLVCVFLAHFPY
jgi:hypothetical protein